VFAGIKRNLLPWKQFENLLQGKTVIVKIKTSFVRSFKNQTIIIKSKTIKLTNNYSKILNNNVYQPPLVFDDSNPIDFKPRLINNMINRTKFFIKKYI
jgi:hypothetical protein